RGGGGGPGWRGRRRAGGHARRCPAGPASSGSRLPLQQRATASGRAAARAVLAAAAPRDRLRRRSAAQPVARRRCRDQLPAQQRAHATARAVPLCAVRRRIDRGTGGALHWRGIDVGAAYLDADRDSLFGFGLPFDIPAVPLQNGHSRGWELYGRVPLFRDIISVDGGLTNWFELDTSIYTPAQSWRAALQAHWVPLESGNLEILARVQGRGRDGYFLPISSSPESPDLDIAPASRLFDGWLVIRIVSVQAFLRWEDMAA